MIIDHQCYEKRRGVGRDRISCCEQCLRYKSCKKNELMPINYYEGALALGMAVVGQIAIEFERAYRRGHKNTLNFLEKSLRSPRTDIITAETYSGVAIADALQTKCEKRYGKFEIIYAREQDRIKKEIKTLRKEATTVKTNEKRKELNEIIRRLKGELNL